MLNWTGTDSFTLESKLFRILPDAVREPRENEFVLFKQRWMVDEYVDLLAELQPRNIFELGIYGFTRVEALLALLARPAHLVAVDLEQSSSDVFDEWMKSESAANVRIHYGVDQANAATLREVVADEFGGEKLDLIIDDASHLFQPSRISLNVLLPHLRTGGLFVIEDWAAQHLFEKNPIPDAKRRDRVDRLMGVGSEPPLTLLLFEAILALAYTGVVDEIRVRRNFVTMRRGADPIDPAQFEISQCYLQRGRDLLNGL